MQDSMLLSRTFRPSTAIVGNLSVRRRNVKTKRENAKQRRRSFSKTKTTESTRRRQPNSGVRRSIYLTRLSKTRNKLRKIRLEKRDVITSKKRQNKPNREVFVSRKTRQRNRMTSMLSRTNQVLVSNPCGSRSGGSDKTLKRHRVAVNKSVRHALGSRGLLDVGGRRKMFDQWITVNSSSEGPLVRRILSLIFPIPMWRVK